MAAEDSSTVRLKVGRSTFELLVRPGSVERFREGGCGIEECLLSETVFKGPARKGEIASHTELESAFETGDMADIIKRIMTRGKFQTTSDERRGKVEEKRKQIVQYIHGTFLDPRSGVPHPVTRIEAALDGLSALKIDPDRDPVSQATELLKRLVDVLPLQKNVVEAVVSIPHAHVGAGSSVVHRFAVVEKEDYDHEGVKMAVSFAPSEMDALQAELARATKGTAVMQTAREAAASAEEAGAAGGKGKGKGKKGKKGAKGRR